MSKCLHAGTLAHCIQVCMSVWLVIVWVGVPYVAADRHIWQYTCVSVYTQVYVVDFRLSFLEVACYWQCYRNCPYYITLHQCCPTFLTPRAAQDKIMKLRVAPVNSKVTTKICWTLIILYLCNCNLLKSKVVHNVSTRYFWQISPLLCHKLSQISDPSS